MSIIQWLSSGLKLRQYRILRRVIKTRGSILIASRSGHGKTFLANALVSMAEKNSPNDTFFIDGMEIKTNVKKSIRAEICSNSEEEFINSDRVVIDDIRHKETLEKLNKRTLAFKKGVIATLHADNCIEAFGRLSILFDDNEFFFWKGIVETFDCCVCLSLDLEKKRPYIYDMWYREA